MGTVRASEQKDAGPQVGQAAPDFTLSDQAGTSHHLAGQPIPTGQKPSFGCGIIWRPGNAPAYLRSQG